MRDECKEEGRKEKERCKIETENQEIQKAKIRNGEESLGMKEMEEKRKRSWCGVV